MLQLDGQGGGVLVRPPGAHETSLGDMVAGLLQTLTMSQQMMQEMMGTQNRLMDAVLTGPVPLTYWLYVYIYIYIYIYIY